MLVRYKRRANVGAFLGFAAITGALLAVFYVPDLFGVWIGKVPLASAALLIIGDLLFVWSCWSYAKCKGRNGAWGLIVPIGFALITVGWFATDASAKRVGWVGGVLSVIGLLVLAFLPDEHPYGR